MELQQLLERADEESANEHDGLGINQQRIHSSPLTPLLTEIGAGAGLGVLRLSASNAHREQLRKHTPHELTLATIGLSLSLGAEELQHDHLLHIQ